MHRVPTILQGYQRVAQAVKPADASKLLKQRLQELKNTNSSPKIMKLQNLARVKQGVHREYFHTSGMYRMSSFGVAYEPWSDDMACILQGTCLPGSTRYCRTNSMFGKMELSDINQGVQVRNFHTTSRPLPIYDIKSMRDFTTTPTSFTDCQFPTGFKAEPWTEDIACVLQGACLPGSTRYCRTNSMFGPMQMSDVQQDAPRRYYSTDAPGDGGQVSQRQRLKLAVRDYGSTVIVFHICISLISLGSFYLAVSSGIDVQALLSKIGLSQEIIASKFATGTSTFVMAYAVHKVFAPVRIGITLTCTPFIVKYLRGIGLLKKAKAVTK
ncbi:uncharacterized protein [Amphiura filiformis]|uniref:uncharacterized protein n=1 Tax=Amphiura filiformis TaxID=82378 RepID=UPI003B20E3DA